MPRLARGEVAEGVRQKGEACKRSSLRRIEVLRGLLNGAESAVRLAPHFRTFAALCAMDSPTEGISPLSPKTLRSYIDELYEGGHQKFQVDVAIALNSLSSHSKVGACSSMKSEREARAEAVLTITQRYDDLLERFTKLGVRSDDVLRELAKHFRLFGDMPSHLRQVK